MRRLTPRFVEKVWGSASLAPLFPDLAPAQPIGEIWYREPDDPILIKFLFTTQKLSVQVHPDDAYAAQQHRSPDDPFYTPDPRGKTEMWHILAAEPRASIAAGFNQQITPDRLRESAQSGEIMGLLTWHPSHPGDTFFIPAGTVHAIGEGLVLCEIQQNSDITYRLYDYGRPRELHLDRSVAVSHLGPYAALQTARVGVLVECPYFTTERIEVHGSAELGSAPGAQSLIVIGGAGQVAGEATRAGDVWRADPGEGPIPVSGELTLLRVT